MAQLIMMYVWYDKNGDIKAITPSLSGVGNEYTSAIFPLHEVEPFLNSSRSTFDFHIRKVNASYRIVKKDKVVNYTRTEETYLTKVREVSNSPNTLIFVNDTANKVISVELDRDVIYAIKNNGELIDGKEHPTTALFNSGLCTAYLTKKNNPYHLLFTFRFDPSTLLTTDTLYFKYDSVYNDTSIYTKKIIDGYFFKEQY